MHRLSLVMSEYVPDLKRHDPVPGMRLGLTLRDQDEMAELWVAIEEEVTRFLTAKRAEFLAAQKPPTDG